jgi:hypothetical protein
VYELAGTVLRSSIPVPALRELPCEANAALNVEEGSAAQFAAALAGIERPAQDADYEEIALPTGSYIRWLHDFEYLLQPQRILWRRLNLEISDEALRSFTFGHVFSRFLAARGVETLHATAAAIDGGAVAFLGNCGYGKSTMASWLLRGGLKLMTDDVLVIRHSGRAPIAYPGLPQIKLLADSASPLFEPSAGKPMCTGALKLIFPLDERQYHGEPAPLAALYLLAPPAEAGEEISIEPTIEPVRGGAALVGLIENLFIDTLLSPERQKRMLAVLHRLCQEVPVRKLAYPRRHDVMPQVVERVVADVRQIRGEVKTR